MAQDRPRALDAAHRVRDWMQGAAFARTMLRWRSPKPQKANGEDVRRDSPSGASTESAMRALPIEPPTVPRQSYGFVRRVMPRALMPFMRGVRKRLRREGRGLKEPYRTVAAYTQTSAARQENLVRLACTVEADGIAGAIVECGVLDGGTAALLGWATRESKRQMPCSMLGKVSQRRRPRTVPPLRCGRVMWWAVLAASFRS